MQKHGLIVPFKYFTLFIINFRTSLACQSSSNHHDSLWSSVPIGYRSCQVSEAGIQYLYKADEYKLSTLISKMIRGRRTKPA